MSRLRNLYLSDMYIVLWPSYSLWVACPFLRLMYWRPLYRHHPCSLFGETILYRKFFAWGCVCCLHSAFVSFLSLQPCLCRDIKTLVCTSHRYDPSHGGIPYESWPQMCPKPAMHSRLCLSNDSYECFFGTPVPGMTRIWPGCHMAPGAERWTCLNILSSDPHFCFSCFTIHILPINWLSFLLSSGLGGRWGDWRGKRRWIRYCF